MPTRRAAASPPASPASSTNRARSASSARGVAATSVASRSRLAGVSAIGTHASPVVSIGRAFADTIHPHAGSTVIGRPASKRAGAPTSGTRGSTPPLVSGRASMRPAST